MGADWMMDAVADIHTAMKLKDMMTRKGIRSAKAKCPKCGNETMQGRLAGLRNHIRFWCDTEGCTLTKMME